MRRLLTMSAAKWDLKKALAGASWVRCRLNPCGKTNYINLCQINRKTLFQPLVCIPFSYFILSIEKYIMEYSRGKAWQANISSSPRYFFICLTNLLFYLLSDRSSCARVLVCFSNFRLFLNNYFEFTLFCWNTCLVIVGCNLPVV